MKEKKINWRIVSLVLAVIILVESVFLGIAINKSSVTLKPAIELTPATVRGKVMTDVGDMLMANIIVEDSDGKTNLYTTNTLSGYEIKLPEGNYTLYYTRGMQYSVVTAEIFVENFKNYYLEDVRLVELYDSELKNFYPGDLHQHTYYSDGADGVEQLIKADIAAGLAWAVLTDHNENLGISEWLQANRLPYKVVDDEYVLFTPVPGNEITTGFGHFNSIGSAATIEHWDIDISKGHDPIEKVATIINEIKRNGAVAQLNHPFSVGPNGFNNYDGLWDLIDNFDTIEIWNGFFEPSGYIPPEGVLNQNRTTMLKWFELLNEGHRLAATGGTDIHSVRGYYNPDLYEGESKAYQKLLKKTGQYAGMPTVFVHTTEKLNTETILHAVKNGHTFISNGPIVIADIDGATYGYTVSHTKTVLNVELFSRDGLEKINIIKNGEYLKSIDLTDVSFNDQIELGDMKAGDWIVIEVFGTGVYYAITNPIFFS